jgi:hypothetical protein
MKGTMTTESKTPETDREMFHCEDNVGRLETHVHVDFARQLELSRDEWKELCEAYRLAADDTAHYTADLIDRFRELQKKEGK